MCRLFHRRNKFRAAPATVQKIHDLEALGRIKMVTNYQLHGLVGKDSLLEEVIVADLDGNTKSLKADILLPFFWSGSEFRTNFRFLVSI